MNKDENMDKETRALKRRKAEPFQKVKKRVEDTLKQKTVEPEAGEEMTNERINEILEKHPLVSELNRLHVGNWQFHFDGIPAYIMTDARQGIDRMRIMAFITENPKSSTSITEERLLRANCHEALDARFCYEHNGALWSGFIHRLSTLHEIDLDSGLRQVTHLVKGFPFKLSSLDMYFKGTSPDEFL